MKIGLVSPYDLSHPGGVTEHILHLAPMLRSRGADVKLMAPASGDLPMEISEAAEEDFYRIGRVIPVPANGSIARITLSFHLSRYINRILDKERFDLIHYHEPLMPALPITVLRASKTCNVGTFHAYSKSSYAYYYGRSMMRRYHRKLHGLVAVSEPARDFVGRYFRGQYSVVPNGVDLDRFGRAVEPIPRLMDGKINILFLGRLEQRKGLGVLLRAYAQVKERMPELRLVIVGGSQDRARRRYETFVEAQEIRDVVFTGFVSDDDKPRYFASAHVYCAPNTGKESFGIVLLEAMASGVPVVASDIPGFAQLITPGREGILVRRDDPLSLASALTLLAGDAELRARLGEAGRRRAQAFSWQRVVDQLVGSYEDAVRRYQRTPFNQGSQRQLAQTVALRHGIAPVAKEPERVHDAVPGLG
ncbi:MAG: glycosyltransferase family 4 protein [Candidatus Dormibacteria bacterium]